MVENPLPSVSSPNRAPRRRSFGPLLVLLGVALVALMTAPLFWLRPHLNLSTVAMLYLIPVLVSTTLFGLFPGIWAALAAFLAYNYFFLKPYHTFVVHESQDIVTLILFLVIAILISQLVGRAKAGLAAAVARQTETARLYELSLALAASTSLEDIASVVARKSLETTGVQCLELNLKPAPTGAALALLLPAGVTPPTPTPTWTLPLETVRGRVGELRLWLANSALAAAEERLLQAFAAQGALALERMALEQAETHARVLEESDRLKTALLSSVSHEFRTPLAIIMAAATSLQDEQVHWNAQARVELLTAVIDEADYLNYLIGNLLDMSRLEAGVLKPNRRWNVLAEILDGVFTRMRRQLREFQVEVDLPDDLPLVPVDYTQLEQVFINLLNNSAKYAPAGSVIQTKVSLDTPETLRVSISNEGPQVAPEHLDRIFDKFYRVTAPEKVSGTGLGLSICKGIIEAHGGRIWAENIPRGLAFTFTLPLTLDGALPPVFEEESA